MHSLKEISTAGPEESMSTAVAPTRLQCPQCSKRFTRPFTLKRHLRTHTSTEPLQCPQCADRFSREDVLARHAIEKHTPSNDKVVCEACKRRVVRRYLPQHRGSPVCRKWQQTPKKPKASSSAPTSKKNKVVNLPPARAKGKPQNLRFLPMDVFWRYADILICSEHDAGLVRRGTLCAGAYVLFLYMQGDRSARVHVRLGLTYATLWTACERLKHAAPWAWAAGGEGVTWIAQLRRQILFTMNILALLDFQLGKVAAAREHWRAFAAMGGNEIDLRGLEDLAVDDANAIIWAMQLADREKAMGDAERLDSYAELLTAGQETGAFSAAYQEAMVKYAMRILELRGTSFGQ